MSAKIAYFKGVASDAVEQLSAEPGDLEAKISALTETENLCSELIEVLHGERRKQRQREVTSHQSPVTTP